jgi:cardiolipin synthase
MTLGDGVDGGVERWRAGDVEHRDLTVDLLGDRGRAALVDIVHDDVGSVGGEPSGEGRSHARPGAGDDGDSSLECLWCHGRDLKLPTVATVPPATNRVLTVPNVVSVIRLFCIPLFLWLLFGLENRYAAAVLLGALGATDWVDGYIARHFGQVSELGKVLDPTADRLLFIVCGGGIIIDGSAPLVFSILVVGREVLVGATLVVLTLLGMKRFDVSWWGKAGTLALMVAFPFFLLGAADDTVVNTFCWVCGWLAGLPGLLFSYYAAISYVPLMRRALAEGRAARTV